ncbi:MAG: DUF962 domain-containing protein [Comamonadaceae bacterium]|nr:MAG: DUF962 domain-containing protein [Comamonadaceae bacterium]
MKTLIDQLAQYGAYHRDPRNITTHFIGVPLITLAVVALLSRPSFMLGALPASPALLLSIATCIFYFKLDTRYGIAMAVELAAFLAVGQWVAGMSTAVWLGAGVGVFMVGWIIQFIGHYYEGKKPAFVDDLVGLLIGPLFVMAEAGFAFGLRPEVQHAIEARVGPVRLRETLAT